MKTIFIFIIIFSIKLSYSQHNDMKPEMKSDAVLIPGLGNYHYEVTTGSEQAQKFFDQGLILIYGFNHNEAVSSFQKAAELDPMMAMAYWGIAYSLGPNYNLPADNEQRKLAYKSMRKALKHSVHCTQKERDIIKALSKRYTKDVEKINQASLDAEFRIAMKRLHQKYPDDDDIATLYAESMMILKPWQLWNKDGTPADGTNEILEVLESVLKRNPNHPGANHYYIHSVEASNDPGRGLPSAQVLKDLIPNAGHLVHMPAHIFFRVGDYEDASLANVKGIEADENYISKYNPGGIYPVMYYNHNLNFISVSEMMRGNFASAMNYANKVEQNVKSVVGGMQMLEGYYANPLFILISFWKWDDILNYPEADTILKTYSALVNFSKGIANASKGNVDDAKIRLIALSELNSKIPSESVIGLNPANFILDIAEDVLKAKISIAAGDTSAAIEILQKAIQKEDSVNYNEPPDWYPSVRLSLGAVLFINENYTESEKVFRDELKKYPHNGRGLFGLMESLKAQGKDDEAREVDSEFKTAWKDAEVILNIQNY